MFSLLSSAISTTIDVIAPPTPLLEQFIWRWNAITHYYDRNDNLLKCQIESTNIGTHLSEMNRILMDEESECRSESSIGAAMEYLLQSHILHRLSVLAQSDLPLGMCAEVLHFFTTLFMQSSLDLIPHKCVFSSAQKLIIVCGKQIAGPYERIEILFLTCISNKISANPDLINCFLKDSFPLITALLALLQSPDQMISTKSGDAIIGLLSSVNENASFIITTETPFCSKIIHQLVTLYQAIPRSLKPEEIEIAINNCFRTEDSFTEPLNTFSPAIRKFLCFLRWFVFFDMVISHLPNDTILMKQLLAQFKDEFLGPYIVADITGFGYKEVSDAEDHIFLTTVLLSNCMRNIASEQLSTTIGQFLLVESECNSLETNTCNKQRLKDILIDRCVLIDPKSPESNHSDGHKKIQLCMSTMQLFEEFLTKPSLAILDNLVMNYLVNRLYIDRSVIENNDPYNDINEFDESRIQFKLYMREDSEQLSSSSSPLNQYLGSSSSINKVLQYFTSLVPDELKSCQTNDELGYETYVREAQKHFEKCSAISSDWKWAYGPINACSFYDDTQQTSEDDIVSSNSQPEAYISDKQFYEGPFLSMIFDNLQYMVQLPYEVNLQVTSLISKLALFSQPNLNEYLLDPTIPLTKGTRTLFTVLHKVVDELQISVRGVCNLKEKLLTTRKELLGETETNSIECEHIGLNEANHTNRIVEALIVIEEFCKELAAVAFVKYHNAV